MLSTRYPKIVLLIFAGCLSLGPLGFVQADSAQQAHMLNERGLKALENQKYERAIQLFESAMVYLPNQVEIEGNLATAMNNYALSLKGHDIAGAIGVLEDAKKMFPGNTVIKENLAQVYNQKAIELYSSDQNEEAIRYLDKAKRLSPDDEVFLNNTAEIFVKQAAQSLKKKEYRSAEKDLKRALGYRKDNINALFLLGQVYYEQQKMKKAKKVWEDVLAVEPTHPYVQGKLDRLGKEMSVETRLQKTGVSNFDIRYERDAAQYEIYDVKGMLYEARRKIGRDFGVYPKYKTIVILYPEDDFEKIRDRPHWLAGMFDGKIRIPLGKKASKDILEKIIFHEYTHVLIQDLTNGNCPIWLNEGLARYEEYRGQKYGFLFLKRAIKQNQLLNFRDFSGTKIDFSMNADVVSLFYDQSYSFVNYLISKFRMYKIRKLCGDLGQGMSLEAALKKEFRMSLDRLVLAWKKSL
ncbi:tetratricopeptide repeat protein [PVC group bacterium]|nr:tetratricopeptide repeat protein [PVC group bacterium]